MAPWVVYYDCHKGSALVLRGQLVAVEPASRRHGSTVLCRNVEELICEAREALEVRVVAATGVGLEFATGDVWLAANLADPARVKQVLLAQTAEQYQGLVHLMEAGEFIWVQVVEDD